MERQKVFVVDVGNTMTNSDLVGDKKSKDCSKLFCKCGEKTTFSSKIRRTIIKNHDTTIEDDESLDSITCKKCGSVYNYSNKIPLITSETEDISYVSFSIRNHINHLNQELVTLYKVKDFAYYDRHKDVIKYKSRIDFIRYNKSTKQIYIFLDSPAKDGVNIINQTASQIVPSYKDDCVSEMITISKNEKIKNFFSFYEYVDYLNLDKAYAFLAELQSCILDIEDIKIIYYIEYFLENNQIISENTENGIVQYQLVSSGFGDGKMVKKRLNVGNYLRNLEDMAKLYFSLISFNNITTILQTKGVNFFLKLISSKFICNPNVYYSNNATSPLKIIEVSANFTKIGLPKMPSKDSSEPIISTDNSLTSLYSDGNYLKISPVLFKSINLPEQIEILFDVYNKYIDKAELENLFQTYETERLFNFFLKLKRSSTRLNSHFCIKHIKHILREGFDENSSANDFLTIYSDTLNVINMLEMDIDLIFKLKTYAELKEAHDNYTVRYNAIKDIKKADFYKKAAIECDFLNDKLGDITFSVIPTLEDLNKEGVNMNHCVYTYLTRICEKNYIAISVNHNLSNEKATLGLLRGKNLKDGGVELDFDQLKGYQNSRATREVIDATIEYINKHKIALSYRNSDLNHSENLQKRMSGQLSESELFELRKKLKAKEGKVDNKKNKKK
jgi:hypothetical protein